MAVDIEMELSQFLEELGDVQEQLLNVLVEKRDAMAANDLEHMQQLQVREQQLAETLADFHQRREAMLEQARSTGIQADTMGDLASLINPGNTGELVIQVKTRGRQMQILQHHSLTNWVLAQRTLLHLSQMLEIFATGGRLKPTYGSAAHSSGSLVDREA